jgi:Tim10/DDP family zinc finger
MSWFGGGRKDEEPTEKSFAGDSHSFAGGGDSVGMSSLGGGSGSGGNAMAEIQQFGIQLQSQMLIQQAITEMSDRAFIKCITSNRDSKLTGKEVACIQACTNKWLDTNELMHGRLARKTQQAAAGAQAGFE